MGGFPYTLCIVISRRHQTPWSSFPLSVLFISFANTIALIALLMTNAQVLVAKLIVHQTLDSHFSYRSCHQQEFKFHSSKDINFLVLNT